MSNENRAVQPGWKRTAIHSALALAFTNVVFVAPAAAICITKTTTISTEVGPQSACPDDTVTVTSTGSVSSVAGAGKGGDAAFWFFGGLAGTLNNSGTISANPASGVGAASVAGVVVQGDLSGSLINSGTISATASSPWVSGVYIWASVTAPGVLTNSGTISASNSGKGGNAAAVYVADDVSGTINNSGTMTASASGMSAEAYGVYVYRDLDGSINNSGTITASAFGSNAEAYGTYVKDDLAGTINNSGTISAVASSGSGSDFEATGILASTLSGTLTNSGTISASASNGFSFEATGIRVGSLAGTINNSGTISAAASVGYAFEAMGIRVGALVGTLTNSGTISATASNGSGFRAYGIRVDTLDGALNNSGRISATAREGSAYSIYAPAAGGKGTINNLAGGQLIGSLAIGTGVAVNNAGTISIPALSPSLFNSSIGGNYTQQAGGLLTLGARSAGSYNFLTVSGTANFTASPTVGIHATPDNTLTVGDTLVAVVSAGTLTGPATYTVVGTPLFTFSGVQNGSGIDVTVTSKSTFSGVLGNALGNTLDGLVPGYASGTGAMDPLLDALYSTNSRDELDTATQNISPGISDGLTQSTFGTLQNMGRIVQSRQSANRGLSSGDLFYGDRQFWFKPFGSRADQGNHSGVTGYDAKTYGMLFGADGEISKTTRVGLAFGYARSDVESNNSGSIKQSGDVDSYQLTGYGNYSVDDRTDLSFQAGYGYHRNDSRRVIRVGLMDTEVAKADYNGWSAHLGAALSRSYPLNPATTVIPTLRADYLHVSSKGYTESGAGVLNLEVKSSNADAFILGADAKVVYALSDTAKLTANLGVGYDVINDRNSVTSAFVGGGAAFSTKGIDQSPWIIRGGLGYVMAKSKAMEVSARYDFETRSSEFTHQTASINLRMPF